MGFDQEYADRINRHWASLLLQRNFGTKPHTAAGARLHGEPPTQSLDPLLGAKQPQPVLVQHGFGHATPVILDAEPQNITPNRRIPRS